MYFSGSGLKDKHVSLPVVTDDMIDLGAVGGAIDVSGCGTTQQCYTFPSGCVPGNDCNVVVTWRVEGDSVLFEMDYIIHPNLGTNFWVAIGLSGDRKMVIYFLFTSMAASLFPNQCF